MKVMRWHTHEGWRCAIVKPGRTKLHVLTMEDFGVRHHAVPLDEERHMLPLTHRGREYPLARARRIFSAFGRERGITAAAKEILEEAT
mgnify:CR=1 FL=1